MGVIEKRQYQFRAAERLFKEVLKKYEGGQRFLTNRDEAVIRYEIGYALDGQGKTREALEIYRGLLPFAATDSYFDMDTRYEIARLELKCWLADHDRACLDRAAGEWDDWLERRWIKGETKLWGFYHGACVYKEITRLPNAKASDKASYEKYASKFLEVARTAEGLRKYDIRFTSNFLVSPDYSEFPGEPLRCDLGALLAEFQLR